MHRLLRTLAPAVAAAAVAIPMAAAAPAQAASAQPADLTTPSLIVCQSATLWGNYDGTHSSDPLATLPYGTRVGWRYNAGGDDMVLWYQGGVWGFVQASCVAVGAG
jgi:hypothetical protein